MFQTKIITDLTSEPVTLNEAKEFMEIDFNDFDALITRLIKSARISSERFTGLSYGKKEIALISNQYKVDIPLGPYQAFVSLKDKDDNEISTENYTIFGYDNPVIKVGTPCIPISYDPYYDILGTFLRQYNEWTLTYYAGFYTEDDETVTNTLPEDLKTAICMRVETAFKYRADATDEAVNKAINTSTEIEFAYRVSPIM
jgi:hypothetical protein